GISQLSTGREGKNTPIGKFSVISKDKGHASSMYGDFVDSNDQVVKPNVAVSDPKPPGTHFKGASMPYYMQIAPGFGLHAGYQPGTVRFSHVIDPAHAFVAGVIAHRVKKTVWILCPSVRAQDSIYETLQNWMPEAQFLPEAEFAAVENILPDPEIAAERLAILAKVDSEPERHVVCTIG